MGSITEILNRAKLRVEDMNLPYEGALLPTEALTLLQENPDARLVDVRSQAEWSWVGRIPGAVEIEWQSFPGMQANPNFLEQLSRKVPKESPVMFICRSGVRSNQAERKIQVVIVVFRGGGRWPGYHGYKVKFWGERVKLLQLISRPFYNSRICRK